MAKRYDGVWPVVPTTFTETGALDLPSQGRVLDCMIDQGNDGLCILANYSEQFLLSDDERERLTRFCLEHVAGRVPVIVTCSHFSTQIVEARCRLAKELGAAMIMLMPPYHGAALRADEAGIHEQFARAADAGGLPIMLQDAPLSGVALSVPFLAKLAKELPLVRYFKIEVPQTAPKLRALLAAGGAAIEGPFDGEEAITLVADLDAGATGCMPSALAPELLRRIVVDHREGRRDAAVAGYARTLPLINYENRQCGLRGCKAVLKAGGVIASDHVRHPLKPMDEATAAGLFELAKPLDLIAMRWGR